MRKRLLKKGIVLAGTISFVLGLMGCGAKENAYSESAKDMWSDEGYYATDMNTGSSDSKFWYDYEEVATEDAMEESSAPEMEVAQIGDSTALSNVADPTRKLITNVDLQVETEHFNDMIKNVEDKVTQLSGYVESMNTSYYYTYESGIETKLQRAYYTVRIPATDLKSFVTMVEEETNVLSRSQSVRDVTLNYVDTESRKEALQVEYDSILNLLAQADTIETIIALESRLSDLRYEIDSLESQLRTYDNKVNYSTVTLTISEVMRYTPVITKEQTTTDKIVTGFKESIQDIKEWFVDMAVSFIISIPYLALWLFVLAIPTVIIVVLIKKNMKKNVKMMIQTEEQHGGQL